MSDDMDGRRPGSEEAPPPQPGVAMAPPPPPPAPPATGEQPPEHRGRGGVVPGLVLIAIGAILLVQQFYPQLDLGRLWPVILIVIGLGIIFRRR